MKILIVTDLHRIKSLYLRLFEAVNYHNPDLLCVVGDFLADNDDNELLSVPAVTLFFCSLKCRVIFVPGVNDKTNDLALFYSIMVDEKKDFPMLSASAYKLEKLVIVGFPEKNLCDNPRLWIPRLRFGYGPSCNFLWLSHQVPTLSGLGNESYTNPMLSEAIEEYEPRLVVCGGDHYMPLLTGKYMVEKGKTCVVNVGQYTQRKTNILNYTFLHVRWNYDSDFPQSWDLKKGSSGG